MIVLPIACGQCTFSIVQAMLPPATIWAAVAIAWFLFLALSRSLFDAPRRFVPRLGPARLVVFLSAIGFFWLGLTVALLYLPFALAASIDTVCHRRSFRVAGYRTVAVFFAAALLALTATGIVGYLRSPGERLAKIVSRPGLLMQIGRIMQESTDPAAEFSPALAASDDTYTSCLIAGRLQCETGDLECAALIVEIADRLEWSNECGTDYDDGETLHEQITRITGASHPADFRVWRRELIRLREEASP